MMFGVAAPLAIGHAEHREDRSGFTGIAPELGLELNPNWGPCLGSDARVGVLPPK